MKSELRSGHPPRIIPLKQFMTSTVSIYHTDSLMWRAASYVVGKPLWWALDQLSLASEPNEKAPKWSKLTGDYIFVETLEVSLPTVPLSIATDLSSSQDAANTIINNWRESALSIGSLSESLHSLETLSAQFASVSLTGKTGVRKLSREDMEVVVKYLSRDKQLVMVEKEVIKLVEASDEKEVTAVDHGVLEMKTALWKLESQVDDITARIERYERRCCVIYLANRSYRLTEQIKENLKQKRKTLALSQLRSRKALEDDLLPKRLRSLEMIQLSLDNVERARGDIEVSTALYLNRLISHDYDSDP